jgi:hypothetical protein
MSLVLYPPSRPQSIGEVLDSAFRVFRATLLRCLPYGVLAMVAGQLPNIYDIVTRRPLRQFGGGDPVWWVLYAVGAFLGMAFVNAILIRQKAMASGSFPEESRRALTAGLRRAVSTIGGFVLLLLAVGVCFVPLIGVPRAYLVWGIIALSVPATYIGVMLSCSWAAMLIGGKGIIASLRYSFHIVRGSWWRAVTIYSVAFAMLAVFYTLAGVIAAVLVPFAGVGDIAVITAVSAVMAAALGAVGVPFYTSMALALYGDLEARKEGTDLERRIAGAAAG